MNPTVFICYRPGWGSGLSSQRKRPYVWTEGTTVHKAPSFGNLKRQVKRWFQENPDGRVVFSILHREKTYRPEDHDPHYLYKWKDSVEGGAEFGKVNQFTFENGNLVRTMAYKKRKT